MVLKKYVAIIEYQVRVDPEDPEYAGTLKQEREAVTRDSLEKGLAFDSAKITKITVRGRK